MSTMFKSGNRRQESVFYGNCTEIPSSDVVVSAEMVRNMLPDQAEVMWVETGH